MEDLIKIVDFKITDPTERIFNVPTALFVHMYNEYGENAEIAEKNIRLASGQYANIIFPDAAEGNRKVGISFKQETTRLKEGDTERVPYRNTFNFWTYPQSGAPSGYIDVFDSSPHLSIWAEKPHDSYYSVSSSHGYTIGGKKCGAVLHVKFNDDKILIHPENFSLAKIEWVLKLFHEILAKAEGKKPVVQTRKKLSP